MAANNPLTKGTVARPDAKIRREMGEFDSTMQKLTTQYRQPDRTPDDDGRELNNAFPARLTVADPYDKYIDLKARADTTVFGTKTMTDADLSWLERKRQNQEYAEFVNWVETYFGMV
jgi:rRNA maturation protein Nop10